MPRYFWTYREELQQLFVIKKSLIDQSTQILKNVRTILENIECIKFFKISPPKEEIKTSGNKVL